MDYVNRYKIIKVINPIIKTYMQPIITAIIPNCCKKKVNFPPFCGYCL